MRNRGPFSITNSVAYSDAGLRRFFFAHSSPQRHMPTEQQALFALDEIEKVIRSTPRSAACAGRGEAGPGADMCADYRQIRPRLDTALPMIDRIPLYGTKIAAAIRFLMHMADAQCRASAQEQ
jgi:hypothetical protein